MTARHSNVRKIRIQQRWKGEEVAEALNISLPAYYKKETGQLRFSLEEAKALSDFFGLSIEEIFFTDEIPKMENAFSHKIQNRESENDADSSE